MAPNGVKRKASASVDAPDAKKAKPTTTAASKKAAAADNEPAKKVTAKKEVALKKTPAGKKAVVKKDPVTKNVAAAATPKSEPAEKPKAAPKPKAAAKPAAKPKFGVSINKVPTEKLDIYVFGEGTSGELGLGSKKIGNKAPIDVKRPRLNDNLSADTVGVVQIAVGGMHCAALTFDNKILTWGVNDQGALGRNTAWDGGLKDVDDNKSDDSDSDDDDDTGMNPNESTPMAVDDKHFPEGTKFVQLTACDSATFALTEDGSVYGWGTFRANDGVLGFTEHIYIQTTPILIPELKKITSLAGGSNHVLALDIKGNMYAWGSGQQNQLGRRIVERTRLASLVPRQLGAKNSFASISSGTYHCFAIDKKGKVWAWGLNNFGETGISEGAGDDNAVIPQPTVVKELSQYEINSIHGGGHHSLAVTKDGKLLAWGRADGSQIGVKLEDVPKENIVFDEKGLARIVAVPTIIPGINAITAAAGGDTSFAITTEGKAYSWGFSVNYQTGQGTTDDIKVATLIDNTAVREKKLSGAGAGGQFGVLTALAK